MKRYIGTKIIHAEPRDKNYGPAEQQGQQAFYSAPVFHGLPESEQSSLFGQGVAMRTYSEILAERIARF